jgi:hypothetical protein
MTEAKGNEEVVGKRLPEQRQRGSAEPPEARGDIEARGQVRVPSRDGKVSADRYCRRFSSPVPPDYKLQGNRGVHLYLWLFCRGAAGRAGEI